MKYCSILHGHVCVMVCKMTLSETRNHTLVYQAIHVLVKWGLFNSLFGGERQRSSNCKSEAQVMCLQVTDRLTLHFMQFSRTDIFQYLRQSKNEQKEQL